MWKENTDSMLLMIQLGHFGKPICTGWAHDSFPVAADFFKEMDGDIHEYDL